MNRYNQFYNSYGMMGDHERMRFHALPAAEQSALLAEHSRRQEAVQVAYGAHSNVIDYHDARFEPSAIGDGLG